MPDTRAAVAVENAPLNTVTDEVADTYSTVTTYRGEGSMLSRYSAGTFVGFHYSVESTGQSVRNAEAVHTAGAFIVNALGESNTPDPLAPGDTGPIDSVPIAGLGSISPTGG